MTTLSKMMDSGLVRMMEEEQRRADRTMMTALGMVIGEGGAAGSCNAYYAAPMTVKAGDLQALLKARCQLEKIVETLRGTNLFGYYNTLKELKARMDYSVRELEG